MCPSNPNSKGLIPWESALPSRKLRVNDTEFSFSIPNSKALWVAKDAANREPEVYSWIDSCLIEKSLFIDVGANFGLYSLYAAVKAQCRVLLLSLILPAIIFLVVILFSTICLIKFLCILWQLQTRLLQNQFLVLGT